MWIVNCIMNKTSFSFIIGVDRRRHHHLVWLDLSGARAEEAGRRVCLPPLRSFGKLSLPCGGAQEPTNQSARSRSYLR